MRMTKQRTQLIVALLDYCNASLEQRTGNDGDGTDVVSAILNSVDTGNEIPGNGVTGSYTSYHLREKAVVEFVLSHDAENIYVIK